MWYAPIRIILVGRMTASFPLGGRIRAGAHLPGDGQKKQRLVQAQRVQNHVFEQGSPPRLAPAAALPQLHERPVAAGEAQHHLPGVGVGAQDFLRRGLQQFRRPLQGQFVRGQVGRDGGYGTGGRAGAEGG